MDPKTEPYYVTYSEIEHADLNAKKRFHQVWKERLVQLARDLNWPIHSFRVRSILGGPAVLGEVILHGEELFIMVGSSFWAQGRPDGKVLYRTVEGLDAYTGGLNQWTTLKKVVEEPLKLFKRWKKEPT